MDICKSLGIRKDGRSPDSVRPVSINVGWCFNYHHCAVTVQTCRDNFQCRWICLVEMWCYSSDLWCKVSKYLSVHVVLQQYIMRGPCVKIISQELVSTLNSKTGYLGECALV